MNIASKVVYVTVGMIRKAVALCVMAQKYMPEGKRFGAIVWVNLVLARMRLRMDSLNSLRVPLVKNGVLWIVTLLE